MKKDNAEGDFTEPAYVIRGTDFPKIEKGNIKEIPFRFHKQSNLTSRKLNHGDIYIMSEKAVGTDWKKNSILSVRHAAGCDKYLKSKYKIYERMEDLKSL